MNVLFVCIGNSGRSVMAERLFRRAVEGRHEARSAGAAVSGTTAEPVVLEALRELGVDASDHAPQQLDDEAVAWADIAVAVCSYDVCPEAPGVRRIGWPIEDPYGQPLEAVRAIRDDILRRVERLAAELGEDR